MGKKPLNENQVKTLRKFIVDPKVWPKCGVGVKIYKDLIFGRKCNLGKNITKSILYGIFF